MKQLFTLTFLLFSYASIAQNYSGGSGTPADPYLIANKADLKYLSENLSEVDKHFLQTANIAFTSADFAPGGNFYNGGSGFDPIGGENSNYFTGTYDGNNYFIDSLMINRINENNIGFFANVWTSNAEVINLHLRNVNITGFNYVGGISAYGGNFASIQNCSVSGSIYGHDYVAGLIGRSFQNTVSYCHTAVTVNGSEDVGGLIGYTYQATISFCSSSGSVSGIELIGGLVGWADPASITNCYSIAAVGGIAHVSGLVGYSISSNIANCYAAGTITAGTAQVSGLVGFGGNNTVTHSFWDVATTGQANSWGGGTPKSTLEMRTQSTFTTASWDFINESTNGTDEIWKMGECKNNGYPVFAWQESETYPSIEYALVNGNPVDSITTCYNSPATLNIPISSPAFITWYDSITAGNVVSVNNPFTTPNLTSDTVYYAQAENGTCVNPFRLQFTVVVRPENVTTNQTFEFCGAGSVTVGSNTYSTSGTYTDVLMDIHSCDSTVITTLTIHPGVNTGVTVDSLTIIATESGATYQWLNCTTNSPIPGETGQTFTGTAGGSYAVIVSNTNCSDTSICTVLEEETNGIDANGKSFSYTISPNPTTGLIQISSGFNQLNIEIYNSPGVKVFEKQTDSGITLCDLSEFEAGMYLIHISSETGQVATNRIIKH